MPLQDTSPAYKSYLLSKQGLSPDKYDLDDNGNVTPKVTSQPSVAPSLSPAPEADGVNIKPPEPPTSIGGTLLHSAENAALPTATGLGAAALGVGLAPETGGLSLLIPLLAGLGGSYAGAKLQEPFQSDAFKQQLGAEAQQHPIASTIGGLAPSMLAFNPLSGIANAPTVAKAGAKLALGRVGATGLTDIEQAALRNAAVNAGVQGGQDIASQLIGGQPFNYGQLGINTLAGGLLNEPWGVGKMLFPAHNQGVPQQGKVNVKPPAQPEVQGIQSPEMETGIANAKLSQQEANANFENTIPGLGDWKKTYENQVEDLEKQRDDLKATADDVNELIGRRTDALNQIEDLKNQIAIAKGEPITDEQGQLIKLAASTSQVIPEAITPAEEERGNTSAMPSKTTTGMFSSTVPAESAVEKAMNKTTRYQEQSTTEQVSDNDPYLLRNASPSYRDAVQKLAARRGISLKEATGLVKPDTGKEVLGAYNPENREALVNPNRAELDTPIHEGVHGYLDDLRTSTNPTDRNLYQRGIGIFGNDEAHAEEALTGKLGVAGVPRVEEQMHGFALRNFNSWFSDYIARWKNTLGVASDKDVIQHLSARYQHDAPYGSRNELLRYTGFQSGFGHMEGSKQYTATDDIKDKDGKMIVAKDSTVSSKTLDKHGIDYQSHRNLLRPTDVGYNDLSSEDKDTYIRLHGEAMVARKEHEVEGAGKSDNLIEKELALKKFSDEKGVKYQEDESKDLKLGLPKLSNKSATHSDEAVQLPLTRSANDTILAKDGPRAKPFIDAINANANQRSEDIARYKQSYNKSVEGLSDAEKEHVENVLLRENKDKAFHNDELSPKEQEAYGGLRNTIRTMQEDRIDANQPVKAVDAAGQPFYRKAKIDPYYWPNQMSPKAIEALERGDTPQANALREDWAAFQKAHNVPDAESKASLDAIMGSYNKTAPNLSHFRGVDVEQGHGLPDSFMRPGLDRNMDRYINRFSTSRAYHDNIESNPEVASLIGEKKTPWGKPLESNVQPLTSSVAKDVIHRLKGQDYSPSEGKLRGYERVASSAMLGPLTNIHILGSTTANALSHAMPSEIAGMVTHMATDFRTAAQHAIDLGNIHQSRPMFQNLFDAHATQTERLNSLADGIGRLNGRNVIDCVAKGLAQAGGEYLVNARIPLAAAGDKQAIRFMKAIDDSWTPDKVYSPEDKIRLAGNFSQLLHGVHDSRTQPNWMLKDNIIQPFTSLMSWNIAQTNNFMKHVLTPAMKDGNYVPLIMNTLGAVLGGYVIKQGREALSNKKSPIPSFNEIANSSKGISGNIPLDVYNLLAMSSYAGYGGILSLGARSLFDLKYKNPAQGAVFPLDEVLSGSASTLTNAASALMNSHDIHETASIATHAVADLFRNNVQGARIAMSWMDEEGALGSERERQKKLNTEEADLRRYKQVEGQPTAPLQAGDENPYLNANRKHFQRDMDIGDAAKQLPSLVSQAMDESGGNIDILKQKLQALKDGQYPSMPSIDHTPRLFFNYLNFLQKTQGNEAASARLIEYLRNNSINKIKGEMVPSF